MIVEICANSYQSAVNAEEAGADRIELCAELAVGGITPSFGLIKKVSEKLSIPIHVLIRPRSGDFTYS
ncbi:MAG: copper homeostasis protein CutC, partial [Eudoraea sp.]